ncbi:hypothetical protein [Mycolicibacterium sp. CR10]|uniref:hypothetical protein n=1 Tax=Mycolicibacterium sp. CR10 TaxID=2562314 RepID=UPI001485B776|nr:hypothetical protein [Mycolicibacterium sp. CR10]
MAARPGGGLSVRGVVMAVRRQLAAGWDAATTSAAFAEAYRVCAGDSRALGRCAA